MLNRSISYIAPMIGINIQYLQILLNTYLSKEDYKFILVYKKTNDFYKIITTERFIKYEKYLITHPHYLNMIETTNNIAYIYTIPERYRKDYDLIIAGQYSHISNFLKKKIINYIQKLVGQKIATTYKGILYKEDWAYKELLNKFGITEKEISIEEIEFTEKIEKNNYININKKFINDLK